MGRSISTTLTDSERRIMDVLWKLKEASVRTVVEELSKHRPHAYTTVLTMFKILEKKGLVTYRQEGRAFIYKPAISRGEARRKALENLLMQFFNGSPDILAQHLISEHQIDPTELQALRDKVSAAPGKEDQT